MNKEQLLKALKEARGNAKKRNFAQTVELIVNFKGLNLKSVDHQVDFYMSIKHPWKDTKICGLVAAELNDSSKATFDNTIPAQEFAKYDGKKKEIKQIARQYDYFVAQANLMPQVAKTFGRFFGPINKMPSPKAGCVVPGNANLEQVKERLNKMIRVNVKTFPMLQIGIGKEESKDEDMAEDVMAIYKQVIHHMPAEQQNVKSIYVKMTMGKPVRVE